MVYELKVLNSMVLDIKNCYDNLSTKIVSYLENMVNLEIMIRGSTVKLS